MSTGSNDKGFLDKDKISSTIDRTVGKPVRRSHSNRWLGGVCGGLAETFGADPMVLRIIAAVLLVVATPVTLLVYLGLYLVLPKA